MFVSILRISCGNLLCRKKKLVYSSRLDVAEIARVAWHNSFQPLWQEKTRNSAHERSPLSNGTVDSVLRHRELGQSKDLSAPPCTVVVKDVAIFFRYYIFWLFLLPPRDSGWYCEMFCKNIHSLMVQAKKQLTGWCKQAEVYREEMDIYVTQASRKVIRLYFWLIASDVRSNK